METAAPIPLWLVDRSRFSFWEAELMETVHRHVVIAITIVASHLGKRN